MREMLEDMVKNELGTDFWSKANGDPYTKGTGLASIRELTNHLRGILVKVTSKETDADLFG